MNKTVAFITKTAMLLALTVLFQSLRVIIPMPASLSQFIAGSLVNMSLIIAGVTIGIRGGLAVAVLTPVVALLHGFIGNPVLVPFVALGNVIIVVIVPLLYHSNRHLAVIAGAAAKFVTLYLLIVKFAFPVLLAPSLPAPQASKMIGVLSYQFSWLQFVTALLGGVLAMIILPWLVRINNQPGAKF
ncbi:MAG: ECF transporter S component [bacterium]|jgi:hypothetical protein